MISRIFHVIVFFGIVVVDAKASLDKYCQLRCFDNSSNTVCDRRDQKCGPDPECGPDFRVVRLSDDDRQYILDIHNYLRNKVALGHEKRGRQPPAADMSAMSYDRELEFMAQCWANACNGNPLVHDVCRRTDKYEYVGQNLGSISSTDPTIDLVKALKELILGWYDEVADYNSTWINDTKPREKETGHYTQLIWASSKNIGCAVSYYSLLSEGQKWYVLLLACDYGPSGNFLGSPVYQVGEPRSRCSPEGGPENKKFRGLCGVDRRLNDTDQFEDDVFKVDMDESTEISTTTEGEVDKITEISTIVNYEIDESYEISTRSKEEIHESTNMPTEMVEIDEITEILTTVIV